MTKKVILLQIFTLTLISTQLSFAKTVHATKSTLSTSVSPEQALGWLKNGNTRFNKANLRNDGQTMNDVKRLSTGQTPHSIVLSCSDSRVPPEIIFDQKLGEIFVVRTAGHVIDENAVASIEYALEHLGVRNIVVMGHTSCGAVKAAFSTMAGQDAGSANLNALVSHIHPYLKIFANKKPTDDYASEAWSNVNGVMAELSKKSPLILEKIEKGEVKINGALYHLDSGKVDFKD